MKGPEMRVWSVAQSGDAADRAVSNAAATAALRVLDMRISSSRRGIRAAWSRFGGAGSAPFHQTDRREFCLRRIMAKPRSFDAVLYERGWALHDDCRTELHLVGCLRVPNPS